jgi:two-component system NarL family sensor kinase
MDSNHELRSGDANLSCGVGTNSDLIVPSAAHFGTAAFLIGNLPAFANSPTPAILPDTAKAPPPLEAPGSVVESYIRRDERGRMARELHDSTAQLLVVLELQLLRLGQIATDQRFEPVLAELRDTIAELHQEMRCIGRNKAAEQFALAESLNTMAAEFSSRTGLAIHPIVGELTRPTPPAVAKTIYRIVQEALANVQRHADARNVYLRLRRRAGRFILLVRDDGIGMPKVIAESGRGSGKGLLNMSERLGEVGGRLTLRRLRKGTLVRAVIPAA